MKCTFVVGQMVVCVADRFINKGIPLMEQPPAKGEVCKIVRMHAGQLVNPPPYPTCYCPSGVWLIVEGHELSWYCSGEFRALQERPAQADISVFRKLLDDVNEEEDEYA